MSRKNVSALSSTALSRPSLAAALSSARLVAAAFLLVAALCSSETAS